jgi:ABC-type amino acid transport substrate-binding protein
MFLNRRHLLNGLVCCVLILCSTSRPALSDDAITVITEDYPPLNYVENDKLQGASVDIVREIKKRLSLAGDIKVYPWARGYKYLETSINTALFSMTRSESREKLFKWVGPLAEKKIGMFARKDRNIKLNSLEDTKDMLIGVQRNGHGMQYLQARGYTNFNAATSALANFRKLMGKRNDLWFSSNATLAGNAKKLGVDVREFELVLPLDNTFMYIAFNKETPDDTVKQWQQTYDAMVKEGVVEKIYQGHNLESLYPTVW